MQYALEVENRRLQAYAMLCFADVHRCNHDNHKALPRYDTAGSLMVEIGDKYGLILVHVGRGKTLAKNKKYEQVGLKLKRVEGYI